MDDQGREAREIELQRLNAVIAHLLESAEYAEEAATNSMKAANTKRRIAAELTRRRFFARKKLNENV